MWSVHVKLLEDYRKRKCLQALGTWGDTEPAWLYFSSSRTPWLQMHSVLPDPSPFTSISIYCFRISIY